MKKKIMILMLAALGCAGMAAGCGRTNFSDDVVVIESEEPVEILGNKYFSKIENY